ncbi:hypothetical protein [Phormidium sp. CCY1219]|uniref:hypothetical protein n=1 Tax=Phormidium sp. CCY1219 TaxID=2886104 RepID=UPI002D1EA808|nr:hypothetical protein [Phormidium sp. CCY1219]MEB3830694.1 hypothetical protein [Phormidium sp. CCY1219]
MEQYRKELYGIIDGLQEKIDGYQKTYYQFQKDSEQLYENPQKLRDRYPSIGG